MASPPIKKAMSAQVDAVRLFPRFGYLFTDSSLFDPSMSLNIFLLNPKTGYLFPVGTETCVKRYPRRRFLILRCRSFFFLLNPKNGYLFPVGTETCVKRYPRRCFLILRCRSIVFHANSKNWYLFTPSPKMVLLHTKSKKLVPLHTL